MLRGSATDRRTHKAANLIPITSVSAADQLARYVKQHVVILSNLLWSNTLKRPWRCEALTDADRDLFALRLCAGEHQFAILCMTPSTAICSCIHLNLCRSVKGNFLDLSCSCLHKPCTVVTTVCHTQTSGQQHFGLFGLSFKACI